MPFGGADGVGRGWGGWDGFVCRIPVDVSDNVFSNEISLYDTFRT